MSDDDRGWMSVREAAVRLAVHESTVRRWVDSGRLAGGRTLGGQRRVERAAVEALVPDVNPGHRAPAPDGG